MIHVFKPLTHLNTKTMRESRQSYECNINRGFHATRMWLRRVIFEKKNSEL
jgi:hypothetical protein